MRRALVLLLLASHCGGSAAASGQRTPAQLAALPRSEVRVMTTSGLHAFQVWIAEDDRSRQQGLMFVKSLPADHGLLFLFDRPQFAAFWMKNTYLSLDIVYIAPDGVVVNIKHDTTPLSENPIESASPVKGVLEVLAGTAARIGLKAGDRVLHPAFAVQQTSFLIKHPDSRLLH